MADALIKDKIKAEMWIADVNMEIEQVNRILKDVNATCISTPDQEDPVYSVIAAFAQKATEFWGGMINGFRKAADNLGGIIKKFEQTTEIVSEGFQEVANKIGK